MKKNIFLLAFFLFLTEMLFAQVGIATTTPSASAALDVTSNDKGVLVPRMTQAQRDAITSPATSLLIYQTDGTSGFYYYNGTAWVPLAGSGGWSLGGNIGTNSSINKIGTTDAQDLKIVTNNAEVARVSSSGNVGIGTTTPTTKLHVKAPIGTNLIATEDFETGTLSGSFTTWGSGNWTIATGVGQNGTYCVQSGAAGIPNGVSNLEYVTPKVGRLGGSLSFRVRRSSEAPNDMLIVLQNKEAQTVVVGGDIAWTTVSINLDPGVNVVKFFYTKTATIDSFNDAIYIDDIVVTSDQGSSVKIDDGFQSNGRYLISDATGVAKWTNQVYPDPLDNDWLWSSLPYSNDNTIYHQGKVIISNSISPVPTTPYDFHVNAGNNTVMTWGSIETIKDVTDATNGDNFELGTGVQPMFDNSISVGSGTKRWTAIYATNGVINTSDIRDKMNIKPMKYGLNEVLQLKPVSYKWKEEFQDSYKIPEQDKETKLGFIAQQIQPILPEVIETHQWKEYEENPGVLVNEEMPRLGMSYSEIIPVITKAIQEQEVEIQELEKLCTELEEMVKRLKKG